MQGKKVFSQVILLSYLCNTLCKFFIKIESNLHFSKTYFETKARDQSIQARKKLFCHVIVNNYLYSVSLKFLIKIESTWRCEIKEQAPELTLRCRDRTVGSSHRRCCMINLFLKFLQYPQQTPVLESIFWNVADLWTATLLKREPNTWVFLWILQNF